MFYPSDSEDLDDPTALVDDEEEHYEVEKILDSKNFKKKGSDKKEQKFLM